MSGLDEIIRQGGSDYIDIDTLYDPEYQGNMYVLDKALKLAGVEQDMQGFSPSAYDSTILKLIDAVPLE